MDFRFDNLDALHWLWGVIALAAIVVLGFGLKRRALRRFADTGLMDRLAPHVSLARQRLRAILSLLALVAIVAALLDPRWGVSFQQVQQRGIDIVIVLDVSRSMLAEDARPNRLERARQYIRDLVEQLAGDRVALVTFAGTASVKCPLTVDYGAFLLSLDTVQPESAARGGSLLGDALRLAGEAFTDEAREHKAIVVFSDGEDHGSYPLEAAGGIAEEKEIPVYTVGIGDAGDGARIPIQIDGQKVYLTYEGQEVWTKMDPAALREIALTTGGAFVPVGTGTVDMGRVYEDRIEPAAKREFETAQIRRHIPRFQWFAGLALVLLLIESFMSERRAGPAKPAWPENGS